MSLTTTQLLNEIYEQQQASMRRMLEAWDKELEAQAEAFKKAQIIRAAQDAVAAQDARALEVYLAGLVAQAKAGHDVSVSIPAGVRVASDVAVAPAAAELEALLHQIDDSEAEYTRAQRSSAWALGHGFMPHPGDLSDLMRGGRVDAPWAQRLADLGAALDAVAPRPHQPLQLSLHQAQDRMVALKDQVSVLRAYGPERTLNLVRDPTRLGPDLNRAVPAAPRAAGRAGMDALNRALDAFQKR
jgi:hypothetical protein